ncbi:MAG: RDD family protein [Myxococcales bacterium]|nr:RDD family protein [Myxococcales bacterium]
MRRSGALGSTANSGRSRVSNQQGAVSTTDKPSKIRVQKNDSRPPSHSEPTLHGLDQQALHFGRNPNARSQKHPQQQRAAEPMVRGANRNAPRYQQAQAAEPRLRNANRRHASQQSPPTPALRQSQKQPPPSNPRSHTPRRTAPHPAENQRATAYPPNMMSYARNQPGAKKGALDSRRSRHPRTFEPQSQPARARSRSGFQDQQPTVRIPPLWQRIGAIALDFILGALVTVQLALQTMMSVEDLPSSYAPDSWLMALAQTHVAISLALGAAIALTITNAVQILLGRTLGQLIFGLRIIRTTTGMSSSRPRALVRCLLGTVGFLLFGAGYVWMLVDVRNRTWHDILTDTVIVQAAKS